MSDKLERIGELIKHTRLRRGLTADEVAERCNVSRSRLYQWEAADYILPKNIKPLSLALRISERRLKAANGFRAVEAA